MGMREVPLLCEGDRRLEAEVGEYSGTSWWMVIAKLNDGVERGGKKSNSSPNVTRIRILRVEQRRQWKKARDEAVSQN